jgi:hypothetical protein
MAVTAATACVTLFTCGYLVGRTHQQHFDWRHYLRRQERLMADFSVLQAEIQKLIAYAQAPRPEDPAIQQQIDAVAGQVKAVNDQVAPPA